MGGFCGYLATVAGLTGGADAAYIYEEKFNIKDLNQDVIAMAAKMSEGVERGLIIRNENANGNYNTEFIFRLFSEEGKGLFSCRSNILGMCFLLFLLIDFQILRRIYNIKFNILSLLLNILLLLLLSFYVFSGHMQQGGSPTPFDRNLGTKMGAKAVEWFSDQLRKCTSPDGKTVTTAADSAVMLGIIRRQYRYTPFTELIEVTDFEYVFYFELSNESL